MDDEVDAQDVAGERPVRPEVVGIPHARDRPAGAQLMGGERGDDVALVDRGHGAHEVGVGRADLLQETGGSTVAHDHQRIEVTLEFLGPCAVALDDRDVVAVRAERPRDVESHLS